MEKLKNISECLILGDTENVITLIKQLLVENINPGKILNQGLIAGMNVVGKKFKDGEYFIPNVLMAAKTMNNAILILEPHLLKAGIKPKGKLLIGTVQGDLHDIGKTLVSIMFKGAGYQIIDLGTNVHGDQFVEAALKENPDIIAMSALLTTTMLAMGKNIDLLRKANVNSCIIIGGAPTSQKYADSIQADFWAASAIEGIEKVTNYFARK